MFFNDKFYFYYKILLLNLKILQKKIHLWATTTQDILKDVILQETWQILARNRGKQCQHEHRYLLFKFIICFFVVKRNFVSWFIFNLLYMEDLKQLRAYIWYFCLNRQCLIVLHVYVVVKHHICVVYFCRFCGHERLVKESHWRIWCDQYNKVKCQKFGYTLQYYGSHWT